MSMDASWPLQQALHAALVADANVSSLVGGRIYDRPPQDVSFPYLTLGDTEVTQAGTVEANGSVHTLTFAVWSRANGRREAKEILSAVTSVLNDINLAVTGHTLVSLQWVSASLLYDRDVAAIKGEVRMRAFTEPHI
ncbi:MAG: DUF3168 domain-containing protein [Parvibaculum sp.]